MFSNIQTLSWIVSFPISRYWPAILENWSFFYNDFGEESTRGHCRESTTALETVSLFLFKKSANITLPSKTWFKNATSGLLLGHFTHTETNQSSQSSDKRQLKRLKTTAQVAVGWEQWALESQWTFHWMFSMELFGGRQHSRLQFFRTLSGGMDKLFWSFYGTELIESNQINQTPGPGGRKENIDIIETECGLNASLFRRGVGGVNLSLINEYYVLSSWFEVGVCLIVDIIRVIS